MLLPVHVNVPGVYPVKLFHKDGGSGLIIRALMMLRGNASVCIDGGVNLYSCWKP